MDIHGSSSCAAPLSLSLPLPLSLRVLRVAQGAQARRRLRGRVGLDLLAHQLLAEGPDELGGGDLIPR